MICKKCNAVIDDNSKFCVVCGAKTQEDPAPVTQPINQGIPNNAAGATVPQQNNAPVKKSSNAALIVSLVLGIFFILIAGIVVAFLYFSGVFGGSKNILGNVDDLIPPGITDITSIIPNTVVHNKDESTEAVMDLPEDEAASEEYVYEYEDTTEVVEEETTEDYTWEEDYVEDEGYAWEEDYVEGEEYFEEEEAATEAPAEVYTNERLIIATGGLRLRSQPNTSSSVRALIPDGSIITILSETDGWVYTYYDGEYGWCSSEFLFIPSNYSLIPLYSARVTAKSGIELITDKWLGTRYAMTTIPYDYIVYVYDIDGDTAFVSYNNMYGYCSTDYLQRRY